MTDGGVREGKIFFAVITKAVCCMLVKSVGFVQICLFLPYSLCKVYVQTQTHTHIYIYCITEFAY